MRCLLLFVCCLCLVTAAQETTGVITLLNERLVGMGQELRATQALRAEASRERACRTRDLCAWEDCTAYCETHRRRCVVEQVDGLLVGFSCDDLSRANSRTSQF